MTSFETCLNKVRMLASESEANRLDEAKRAVDDFIASAENPRSRANLLHILERTIEGEQAVAGGPFLPKVLHHIAMRFREMRAAS